MSQNNIAANTKRPSHHAYQVQERAGKKSVWTKIGAAWLHSDHSGFSIQLHAVPLDGRITLRVASERKTNQQ